MYKEGDQVDANISRDEKNPVWIQAIVITLGAAADHSRKD